MDDMTDLLIQTDLEVNYYVFRSKAFRILTAIRSHGNTQHIIPTEISM